MARPSITKNASEEDLYCSDVVRFDRRASPLELVDAIQGRCAQMSAQLTAITGEGLEHFDSLSTEVKRNYLWAVEQKFSEISVLFDLFWDITKRREVSSAKHKQGAR
jgi:hypothetical protein